MQKSHPKVVKPRDLAGNAEEEEEKVILLIQSSLEQDDNDLLNILPLHTKRKYNKVSTKNNYGW